MATTPLADTSSAASNPARIAWLPVAWFGLLLITCYAPILYRMANQWATDDDMGHGFFVPVVAGYIVWQRRQVLAETPCRTNWWGWCFLAVSCPSLQRSASNCSRLACPS